MLRRSPLKKRREKPRRNEGRIRHQRSRPMDAETVARGLSDMKDKLLWKIWVFRMWLARRIIGKRTAFLYNAEVSGFHFSSQLEGYRAHVVGCRFKREPDPLFNFSYSDTQQYTPITGYIINKTEPPLIL